MYQNPCICIRMKKTTRGAGSRNWGILAVETAHEENLCRQWLVEKMVRGEGGEPSRRLRWPSRWTCITTSPTKWLGSEQAIWHYIPLILISHALTPFESKNALLHLWFMFTWYILPYLLARATSLSPSSRLKCSAAEVYVINIRHDFMSLLHARSTVHDAMFSTSFYNIYITFTFSLLLFIFVRKAVPLYTSSLSHSLRLSRVSFALRVG
jgi:hypothetical protein